jgi:ribosome biogenesis protein SSF1/2
MRPWTAPRLKERSKNKLKDFLHISGPLGVTHFLILKSTDVSTYFKIARVPQGPTLTFRLLKYSTCMDVQNSQEHPHPPGKEYLHPVVLVRNGFVENPEQPQIDLMNLTFKEIFPPIPVEEVNLDHCKRTVLFEYNPESDVVEFRHYVINSYVPSIKKKINRMVEKKGLSLGDYKDIGDCVFDGQESDREETVIDMKKKKERSTKKEVIEEKSKTISLKELGPRMQLQLYKVQEGFFGGDVHYHKFVKSKPKKDKSTNQQTPTKSTEEISTKSTENQTPNSNSQKKPKLTKSKSTENLTPTKLTKSKSTENLPPPKLTKSKSTENLPLPKPTKSKSTDNLPPTKQSPKSTTTSTKQPYIPKYKKKLKRTNSTPQNPNTSKKHKK